MQAGDHVLLAANNCSDQIPMDQFGFALQWEYVLQDGPDGLQVTLGQLPASATAGTYDICWCPADAPCTSPEVFRAPAGQLSVDCPDGFFATGLQPKCRACPRGYFCPGGPPASAQRFPCGTGLTTLNLSASSSANCVCDAGLSRSSATGQCIPCELGWYKSKPGNGECYRCPENYTTFSAGSANSFSCIKTLTETETEDNANETPQDGEGSQTNVSDVKTVVLNVSLEAPSDVLLQLKDELPALLLQILSDMTRLDTSVIKIDSGATAPGRRLRDAMKASWVAL